MLPASINPAPDPNSQGSSENDGRSNVLIVQSLRSFLTAVTPTAVIPTAVAPISGILPVFK